jgi:hypothetical protein
MQLIESIETISHSSNSDSKNTSRQTKTLTWGFVCQVQNHHPWSLRLRWGSLSCPPSANWAGSLLTAFLTSLTLASFLSNANRTFTNFLMPHHNLGSTRATPSRLGGFTFKSNKCHKNCYTKLKYLSAHKEDLTQPLAWISHKWLKPHLEVKGRVFSLVEPAALKGGKGGSFYTIPKKLAIGN